MKYWEYKIEDRDTLDVDTLDIYGCSGWELVQIHRKDNGQLQSVFKREKKRILRKKK